MSRPGMNLLPASMSIWVMTRFALSLLLISTPAWSDISGPSSTHVHYIANMGVMIEHGETKVLFDPLFRNNFETFDAVPAEIEMALLSGNEPWHGIDAVFVSHYHEDHFDPTAILGLLRNQPSIKLFTPEQSASAIRELVADSEESLLDRIHGLSLENHQTAADIEIGSIVVESIRIPHSGWPDRHSEVENIVFRVTLDGHATVTHFGDADAADEHFAEQPGHWHERDTDLALPPYWFFLSEEGRRIVEDRIGAEHVIGLHVPMAIPDYRSKWPVELQDVDLFTKPGETRTIEFSD